MNDTAETAASVKEIAELAKASVGAKDITIKWDRAPVGIPSEIPAQLILGSNPGIRSLKALFEEHRQYPSQKAGTATALTLQSFIDLTNRHKIANSAIFANSDWKKPGVQAVIDYHDLDPHGLADNLRHRIAYEFPLSLPWQIWVGQNGKPMEQAEFASFIEDHIADLSSPTMAEAEDFERTFGTTVATPADLIQLSRGLQIYATTEVKNAVTLQSGEGSIVFVEEHRDAGGNKLTVPGIFILQVEPFFQGERIRMPVRLRYRKAGAAIVWSFHLYRPDVAVTDRVRADLGIIARDTALPVFEGFPETSAPN